MAQVWPEQETDNTGTMVAENIDNNSPPPGPPVKGMTSYKQYPIPIETVDRDKGIRQSVIRLFKAALSMLRWIANKILGLRCNCTLDFPTMSIIATAFCLFYPSLRRILPKSTDYVGDVLSWLAFAFLILDIVIHLVGTTSLADLDTISIGPPSWLVSMLAHCIPYVLKIDAFRQRILGYPFGVHFWIDLLVLLGLILRLPNIHISGDDSYRTMLEQYQLNRAMTIPLKVSILARGTRLLMALRIYSIKRSSRPSDKSKTSKPGDGTSTALETELYDLTMERLYLGLLAGAWALTTFTGDGALHSLIHESTAILHQAKAGQHLDVVMATYLKYFSSISNLNAPSLVYLQLNSSYIPINDASRMNTVRNDDLFRITYSSPPALDPTVAIFDLSFVEARKALQDELLIALFFIGLLAIGGRIYRQDLRVVLIRPLSSIVTMVKNLALNPLGDLTTVKGLDGQAVEYETRLIQLSITKITGLLRVGFGVAGADIIAKNMDLSKKEVYLDPLVPGKRVLAIFGFCDIHRFNFIVRSLGAKAMTFVNNVARIVHENVSTWGGTCNKNLGNAFLVVWRIGDEQQLNDMGSMSLFSPRSGGAGVKTFAKLDIRRIPGVDAFADQALIGFLKVLTALQREKQILDMCNDPLVRSKNGDPFHLDMVFGLHAGWAIEGAVGSPVKVDATYLSPHVNMAARMETACRQYGVHVLMTENFWEILSAEAQKVCRRLDVVTVKGSDVPKRIYTYDTYLNQVFASRSSFKTYSPDMWKKDKDLICLKEHITDEFRAQFRIGVTNYIDGLWSLAKEKLEHCNQMLAEIGGDGPSRTLINYMAKRNFTCPQDWKGFRPLTSK